jgi:pyruvate dehydrogenase E1 component
MASVPDQIRQFLRTADGGHRTFTTLGTDGMGRSDTREALRRFFEIDTGHVVVGVLSGLLAEGTVDAAVVEDAISRYDIDTAALDPWTSYTA